MKKVIADPSLVRNDFFVPPIKPDKLVFDGLTGLSPCSPHL